MTRSDFDADTFIIYQGHHGDAGAEIADLILPGAAYTEKEGVWVNTEGRSQRGYPAVTPPGKLINCCPEPFVSNKERFNITCFLGDARVDWKIIRAISEVAAKQLPYDTVDDIRRRLVQIAPHFARYGDLEDSSFLDIATQLAVVCFLLRVQTISNFYLVW